MDSEYADISLDVSDWYRAHQNTLVNPNYVIGCYHQLYSMGHVERVDHEYTLDIIHRMIDDRIIICEDYNKKYHLECSFENSVLALDVIMDYDEYVDDYLSNMSDTEYRTFAEFILRRAYKNGFYHTTDLYFILCNLDIARCCYDFHKVSANDMIFRLENVRRDLEDLRSGFESHISLIREASEEYDGVYSNVNDYILCNKILAIPPDTVDEHHCYKHIPSNYSVVRAVEYADDVIQIIIQDSNAGLDVFEVTHQLRCNIPRLHELILQKDVYSDIGELISIMNECDNIVPLFDQAIARTIDKIDNYMTSIIS